MTQKIEKLIVKYITKSATAVDLDILSEWIKDPTNETVFKDYVQTHYAINYGMNNPEAKRSIEKLLLKIKKHKSIVYRLKKQSTLKYAAAIIIGIMTSTYFFGNKNINNSIKSIPLEKISPVVINNNIEIGKDKATLTLGDGGVVVLDEENTFKTDKVKSNGKELIYNVDSNKRREITYNYLTIPRGGQFHVKLSDGTEIWLNSESQLKYPVAFVEGVTREVELVYGEGYFDVSPSTNHNGSKFRVINKNQEIEVLGTEFNIKAYKGEDIYTTLVEGKVTVSNSFFKKNLTPNQQSKLNVKDKNITINTVDIYSETSWKKGLFSFKSKPLKEIMTVLSRWYDVTVVFTNSELEKVKFNGVLSKNDNIEEILLTIKKTNFINDYEIKDKTIVLK
ncbi:FecR family protein [Thalassobellus sediminis]|uniref:FecR family protein n=1 Tax=Thalassobellus sediminis TaxID=3367753 RepID=UPI00378AA18B